MPFEIINYDGSRRGGKFVTIDKFKRLCLSSALRKELSVNGTTFYAYISYDKENHRIGLVKQELARAINDVKPAKFDKRGYTSAKPILIDAGLSESRLPIRFVYDGDYHDGEYNTKWLTFKRSESKDKAKD